LMDSSSGSQSEGRQFDPDHLHHQFKPSRVAGMQGTRSTATKKTGYASFGEE